MYTDPVRVRPPRCSHTVFINATHHNWFALLVTTHLLVRLRQSISVPAWRSCPLTSSPLLTTHSASCERRDRSSAVLSGELCLKPATVVSAISCSLLTQTICWPSFLSRSGESGAGKTESAKFLVRHVLHLSGCRIPHLADKINKVGRSTSDVVAFLPSTSVTGVFLFF